MPSGRGGAGNIQAVVQDKERAAADLEAKNPTEESTSSTQPPNTPQRSNQQYAYAGRGGAGNFYSTNNKKKQIQPLGEFSNSKSIKSSLGQSTRVPGRGGAGNYEFIANGNTQTATLQKAIEQRSQERIAQKIERDVEEQLALPPKAKLVQARPFKS